MLGFTEDSVVSHLPARDTRFWAGIEAAGDKAQPAPALGTRGPRHGTGVEGKQRGDPGPALASLTCPVK